jgi:hypothetical protein
MQKTLEFKVINTGDIFGSDCVAVEDRFNNLH